MPQLLVILFVLGFMIAVGHTLSKIEHRVTKDDRPGEPAKGTSERESTREEFPYTARRYLLTRAERSFYGVLEQATSDRYKVMAKVRLGDILLPRKGLDPSTRTTALNRIHQKHVDFVLCDPSDLSIACVIELDDKSHERQQTKTRDAFVDGALEAGGVRILRFPARGAYDVQEVRAIISGS